jgi:UMF1 family MFS transporter
MPQNELIACFILIHVVAIVGSLVVGYLGDRMTTKRAINITLLVWTAAVIYVLMIDESWEFWVLAVVIGFVLGGVQASSRALLAQFTPQENSAEFFGFFASSGKFASIFGPALFALITDLTGSVRYGVASILVFFVVGWIILNFVDEEKGILESQNLVE